MKIAIICDSFKESLSALEVADEIEAGFHAIWPDATCIKLPAADGGEGTVSALIAATQGRIVSVPVTGPLGETVTGFFGITGDGHTAVIEMAAAAGLELVPASHRDPLKATTRGVGELLRAALDAGCRHIILGLGGSATNDGGAGLAQALGAHLLDAQDQPLPPGGAALATLARIDISGIDPRLVDAVIDVACDVDNPLTGPTGASEVFGPQKGATAEMVQQLDAALAHYAMRIAADLGCNVASTSGAGAAGGMGAAALAFLGARLRPGVDIVLEALNIADVVREVDLVITGEGRMDGQTVRGKAPAGVARLAKLAGTPVIGIAGSLGSGVDAVHAVGIDALFSTMQRPSTLAEAVGEARESLRRTARNVAATLHLGRSMGR